MASKFKRFLRKVAPVILIAAIIVQPQLVMTVGTSMGFTGAGAAAAGAATIQTATALALGAPPDQAMKMGAIAAVTAGTGFGIAAETGSNVIGGAAGSAIGTTAGGGSSQDVIRNAAAGGIANGFADAGSASAGKATAALITTGGDVNAAAKAYVTTELIQAGQQGYKSYNDTKTAELNQFNQTDTPVTVAGATPEQQAAAGAQQLVETAKAQPGTQLAQAPTDTVSDVPEGGRLQDVIVTATPEPEPRPFDPTLTFSSGTGLKAPSATTPAQTRDQQMVDLIKPTESADTTQPAPSAPSEAAPSEAPAEQKAAEQTRTQKSPPITYTGVKPLAQTLGTSFSLGAPTSGITTGLTGERGAGEIESKETGKQRKNVWNEASLRLKDALGV